jgi:hypothetical protein
MKLRLTRTGHEVLSKCGHGVQVYAEDLGYLLCKISENQINHCDRDTAWGFYAYYSKEDFGDNCIVASPSTMRLAFNHKLIELIE